MGLRNWKDRIPLDRTGLAIFGAALYLREKLDLADFRRARLDGTGRPSPLFGASLDLPPFEQFENAEAFYLTETEIRKAACRADILRDRVASLGAGFGELQRARTVQVSDFQFEWNHLIGRDLLVIHLRRLHNSKRNPKFCRVVWAGSELVEELRDLWEHEVWRVVGGGDPVSLSPRDRAESLFRQQVEDIAAPSRRGAPSSPRIADDLEQAVEYAHFLHDRGHVSSVAEAARCADAKFYVGHEWARPENKDPSRPDQSARRIEDALRARLAQVRAPTV